MRENKNIKILGAGISGLTAAINLSKSGFDVEVYERNADCGLRFSGDMQGLENWTEKTDVLDSLAVMQIETNFKSTPFKKVSFTNCDTTEDFSFNKPLFYLVKRGIDVDSLDQGLKQQALAAGVKILFNQSIDESSADIVATGPRFKHITIADKGIVFKTNLDNMVVGIVNEKAAYKGYAYLLVVDGYACLCSCIFDDLNKLNDCFEFTKKYFVDKYHLSIKNPRTVGGVGYFSIHNIYKKSKTLFVGEAAGLQDFLAGFGMRTAFSSGYLAAQSIIKNLDYEKLAVDKYKKHLEAGIVNRFAWEHLKINNHINVLKSINNKTHNTKAIQSIYNFNLFEHIEYPIALEHIKKQYPDIVL